MHIVHKGITDSKLSLVLREIEKRETKKTTEDKAQEIKIFMSSTLAII